MNTYIYILKSGNEVRYVGKANNPAKRLSVHKADKTSRKNPHLYRWIKKNNISLEVIDEVSVVGWQFWEQWYIELFRTWGFCLLNLTKGGDGCDGYKHSDETKAKMKLVHKRLRGIDNPMYGRKRPEMAERNRRLFKGKKLSESQIEKCRIASTGKRHSPETIAKCSEAKRKSWASGAYSSPEYAKKHSDLRKGKPNPAKRKKIICNETNVVYESLRDAAAKIGGSIKCAGNISSQLRGKIKTAYGYTYSFY